MTQRLRGAPQTYRIYRDRKTWGADRIRGRAAPGILNRYSREGNRLDSGDGGHVVWREIKLAESGTQARCVCRIGFISLRSLFQVVA